MTATTAPAPTGLTPNAKQRPRLRRLTKVAGSLYLFIFVVYPLSVLVRSSLVIPGDALATADNIRAQETLFRWGMAGEATIVLVEIVLAAVLYALLRPVSRAMSLAASLARVSEAVVMAAGCLVTSVFTLLVIGDKGFLAAFDADQRDALALFFQEANDDIVLVWGFFFALSLALTGWLVYRSGFLPRLPGILLALAGVGYFVQSFGTFLAPGLADTWALVVLVLAIPGELIFALWLLIKGVDEDAWTDSATRADSVRV
jgi:Domain of unknown function (DUF4386)